MTTPKKTIDSPDGLFRPFPAEMPGRLAEALPDWLTILRDRQLEILAARPGEDLAAGRGFASCGMIATSAGGPSGIPTTETASLQAAVEALPVACWVEVIAHAGPPGFYYTIRLQWVQDGTYYWQELFANGVPITPRHRTDEID